MADTAQRFLSCATSVALLEKKYPGEAKQLLLDALNHGLVTARAQKINFSDVCGTNRLVPRDFWLQGVISEDWRLGVFSVSQWLSHNGTLISTVAGVEFNESDVRRIIDDQDPSTALKQGRLPADWWDDLWVEMCRLTYEDPSFPKKTQTQFESAMSKWFLDNKMEGPAESTLRLRARKLRRMFQKVHEERASKRPK